MTPMDKATLPADVLFTNFVPERFQIPEVHSIIRDLHKQVASIEDEVADAKMQLRRKTVRLRTLRELRARQRGFRKTISQYEALFSPMRAVPPEVLAEIFAHTLPPSGTFIQTADAPLLLTRVCRRWRYVAISTPRLWTSLSMGSNIGRSGIVADVSKFGLDPILIADMWITRSGSLPLDIQLQIPDWTFELVKTTGTAMPAHDINQEVMAKLTKHVHRWRHFKACVFGHTVQEFVCSNTVLRAPVMESFDICHPGAVGHLIPELLVKPEIPHFEAPRVSEFILKTAAVTFNAFSVQYRMLCRLTVHSSPSRFPIDKCLEALAQCTSLEYLDITLNMEMATIPRSPRPPISLPQLQELSVKYYEAHDVPVFIQPLHLPCLKTLEFYHRKLTWDMCEHFWTAFEALLARSRPPLHELCLTTPSIDLFIAPVLRALPTLEILDFQLFSPSPSTLQALTPSMGEPWLCPRLRALYLANLAALDVKEVISLVKARVPPGRRPWDGGSRPIDRLEGKESEAQEGRYLTELGVWNAKGVGYKEERKLLAFARKGGSKMKFTIQRDKVHTRSEEEEEEDAFTTLTARQFRTRGSVA